jgi:WhiB family redox-sensing transcriptional regulator
MPERTSSLARLFRTTEPENDWRTDAACKGIDPELFFSSEDLPNKQDRIEREAAAKNVCARCGVQPECLSYAIAAGERYGIWGGLNPAERRAHVRAAARSDGGSAEQVS